MEEMKPIFKEEIDRELEEKTKRLIEQKLAETEELKKKDVMKEKIDKIKETLKKEKEKEPEKKEVVKEAVDCPTCGGHDLHVHENIAKCTSPNCGKEFWMAERSDKKKDYLCTTCGTTLTKEEAIKLKGDKTCPGCGKGKEVFKMDDIWKLVDNTLKAKSKDYVKVKEIS